MAELSPMMQQYFEIKKEYPDAILFFRLGDFYEMFFEDAKTASRAPEQKEKRYADQRPAAEADHLPLG